MTCGSMVKVKKMDFDGDLVPKKANLPQKSKNFLDFLTSKLQKYLWLRECGYSQKSKKIDFL